MLTWLRKNMKAIMIVIAVLFAASMFYGLGYSGLSGGPASSSNVLAKVNGQEVDPMRYREILNRTLLNFKEGVSPQDFAFIENLALGQAIDFTLILGEAKKKVRVSGAEIDSALDNIMRSQKVPSKRELENALKRVGLTMGKFRDLVRDDIYVQKLSMKLRQEVNVTPDDLREIKASHILLTTEAEAKTVLEKIKKGEDFSVLARRYSKDPGSASKGGDLGYFAAGSMVAPFDKAAFALKIGEVSGIVKSPFGYHIIKAADSRLRKFAGNEKDFEKAALLEKQEKTFRSWYGEVRGKAKIEIISPELRGNDLRFKGMVKEAIEEYKKAIQQNPTNPYLHVFLGDAYLSVGRKDLALAEYENAVKTEGGNPEFYLVLGKAYGDKTLAAEQYRKASLIAGDDKNLHEKLLKLFQNMKLGKEVVREKSEIKRIDKKEKFEKELQGGR